MSAQNSAAPSQIAALTDREVETALALLGREPSVLEWALIGAAWSEHCSYKHSRHLLRRLPTRGMAVVSGPGGNAGVVRCYGRRIAFKVESHNHPSAENPVEGAATGVGGILRDIEAMGVRPRAILDGLCAGLPEQSASRKLLDGMVEGISSYGNAVGVPNVGGFLHVDARYEGVPLVNAMAIGWDEDSAPDAAPHRATARRPAPGDELILFGPATGPDGLGGAVFASAVRSGDGSGRKAVQVSDPFRGRLLLTASAEISRHGQAVMLQDLGAAGLAGACAELADQAGHRLTIDLKKVPLRGSAMPPEAILLSETQERMLALVPGSDGGGERGGAALVRHLRQTGLQAAVIGRLEAGEPTFAVQYGQEQLANLPTSVLIHGVPAPEHLPLPFDPALVGQLDSACSEPNSKLAPSDLDEWLAKSFLAPSRGSRSPLYRAFDHTVGTLTVRGPGGEAAVLRLSGASLQAGVAVVLVGGPPLPGEAAWHAAERQVRTAYARLSAVGARPLGLTDGLNLSSPETRAGGETLAESVAGVGLAAQGLHVPVTGGNVSLYNVGAAGPVPPTTAIGMVGSVPLPLKGGGRLLSAGCQLGVIGRFDLAAPAVWASRLLGLELSGRVEPTFSDDRSAAAACRQGVRQGLIQAALAFDAEGLLATVLRAFLADEDPPPEKLRARGARLIHPAGGDDVAWICAAADGCYLVAVRSRDWPKFARVCKRLGTDLARIGETVTDASLSLVGTNGQVVWKADLDGLAVSHRRALAEAMGWA